MLKKFLFNFKSKIILKLTMTFCLFQQGYTDIYSRVKRKRKQVKRDMYGMPIETDNDDNEEEEGNDNGTKSRHCLSFWYSLIPQIVEQNLYSRKSLMSVFMWHL